MPFNVLPASDFVDREDELSYLRLLVCPKGDVFAGNVLLEGTWGIGKTELMKQLYRSLFWEGDTVLPFYYSFRSASVHAADFARDYFVRFVRQYAAWVKKDPALADNMSLPLSKIVPIFSGPAEWMVDLIDDFQALETQGSLHELVLGAVSAPVRAAREGGMPVLVMLDDFPIAEQLCESSRGDAHGLAGLFGESLSAPLCPHLVSGSPQDALERIFSDNAFRGKAERMSLGPLPEDASLSLFVSLCKKNGINGDSDLSRGFVRNLGGNPLYIRNAVKALRKMGRKDPDERDLWECYSFDVTGGETAFYWSSVLGQFARGGMQREAALKLLMRSTKAETKSEDRKRLSGFLGVDETVVGENLDLLKRAGLIRAPGRRDAVLDDVIHGLFMAEMEGRTAEKVRALIEQKHYPAKGGADVFELVIPMAADAELVAARTIEQIGRNINIDPEAIQQIQTALIECCINAFEHSSSSDRKVFIKVAVSPERLEMRIESRGRFFDPAAVREPAIEEKLRSTDKRGWGLKLMKNIMDEVKVARAGDFTRVTLAKNFKPDEASK